MERVEIKMVIEQCDECPHARVEQVLTVDSFENVRKIHCNWRGKDVYSYLEWRENSPVPKDCPARVI